MSDEEFDALARSIKRRIWGFPVARISDSHRDFYWSQHHGFWSRFYDRFEPFIHYTSAIALTLIVTPVIALIFIAL